MRALVRGLSARFRAAYFEELRTEFISPADVRRGIERLDLAATDFHSDATDLLAGAAVACLVDRDATAQRGCEEILDSRSPPGPGILNID